MIRCKEAKQNLLIAAVKHYKKSTALFTFISLYDDNEPYPLDEVIYILKCKCDTAKREINNRPNSPNMDALETIHFIAQKQLDAMLKQQRIINGRMK